MDNHELQEMVKNDLMLIPTFKLGILSAWDFYGSLAAFVLKLSLVLMLVNTMIQWGVHGIGFFYPTGGTILFFSWGLSLVGSSFVGIFVSQFILFGKMVKGRLKTESLIKKKCMHFSLLYLFIYCLLYVGTTLLLDSSYNLSVSDKAFFGQGWDLFNITFAQLVSLLGAMLGMSILANIEISRLGIGIVFDVVNTFVAQIKNSHAGSIKSQDGSHD
jgi:hypothetical protein